MAATSRWTEFSRKHPFGRLRILAAVDFVIALTAFLVVARFGVWSTAQSDPPQCFNGWDERIDCSLETPVQVLQYVVFFVVLFGLIAFQVFSSRRQAASADR